MIAHGIAMALLGCAALAAQEKKARFFDDKIAPILTRSCLGCHNHELDDGNISFENPATLLKERAERPAAVVPGKPEQSPLVRAIRHNGDIQMPPGKKLPNEDIDLLTEWIKRGAVWGTKLRSPE